MNRELAFPCLLWSILTFALKRSVKPLCQLEDLVLCFQFFLFRRVGHEHIVQFGEPDKLFLITVAWLIRLVWLFPESKWHEHAPCPANLLHKVLWLASARLSTSTAAITRLWYALACRVTQFLDDLETKLLLRNRCKSRRLIYRIEIFWRWMFSISASVQLQLGHSQIANNGWNLRWTGKLSRTPATLCPCHACNSFRVLFIISWANQRPAASPCSIDAANSCKSCSLINDVADIQPL